MKERVHDLLSCLKVSLLIFLIPVILGTLIGVIIGVRNTGIELSGILTWIFNIGTWMASFGLFICAIAFIKTETLRPLNYESQWKKYFYKFNLISVIFFICIFMFVFLIILDYTKYIIK